MTINLDHISTRDELKMELGVAFHTAFRKATDSSWGNTIWSMIDEDPEKEWEWVLDFVVDCLGVWREEE